MHKKISEDWLIDGCIEGDRYAQKMLFDKYRATMFAVCMRYTKNKMEAEDVMIDGFMMVYANIANFKRKGSFEGWIRKIMINTSINNYRSNIKNNLLKSIDDEDYLDIRDDSDAYKDEYSVKYLMDMIQSLPDGYRMVFNLFEIEGYSHKEIAKMFNVTTSTTKTQLYYAKKALKSKIEKFNKSEQTEL